MSARLRLPQKDDSISFHCAGTQILKFKSLSASIVNWVNFAFMYEAALSLSLCGHSLLIRIREDAITIKSKIMLLTAATFAN